MPSGKFITFEGGEGAGKSTQIKRLAAAIEKTGLTVTVTREPGGSRGAETIRAMLLDPDAEWDPPTEALLHFAARADHYTTKIAPALKIASDVDFMKLKLPPVLKIAPFFLKIALALKIARDRAGLLPLISEKCP